MHKSKLSPTLITEWQYGENDNIWIKGVVICWLIRLGLPELFPIDINVHADFSQRY